MSAHQVLAVCPESYQRNSLHDPDMPWQETNCYVDVWIEVIHALGFEVESGLAYVLGADFEQDQWTFFKPPLNDLSKLYGIEVEELTLWRDLPEHCESQISSGSLPLLEVDAFYLPDTVATDYRRNHVKTTIAMNEIDLAGKSIGYFHNTGYHRLTGADYDGLFRLDRETPPDFLPPYCEIIKTNRVTRSAPTRHQVVDLIRMHAARRPANDPFARYSAHFQEHLEWVKNGGLPTYHAYVFASLRQCGSAFDLAARLLRWMEVDDAVSWSNPAAHFEEISATCKLLLLKLARIANGKEAGDYSPQLEHMSASWLRGFEELDAILERA